MNFNKLGKQVQLDGNFFYTNLSQARQTMFKRAFNLMPERNPIVRKERLRDEKGKVKSGNPVMNYQETLLESRQYIEGVIETFAQLLGVEKSQAVHAIVTGNVEAFTKIILKRISSNIQINFRMVENDKTGELERKRFDLLNLPSGHRWKGNPNKIDKEDVEKGIKDCWVAAGGVLTEHEQAAEGGEGALAKHFVKEKAKKRRLNDSRKGSPNISKGARELNARQSARNEAVAGA